MLDETSIVGNQSEEPSRSDSSPRWVLDRMILLSTRHRGFLGKHLPRKSIEKSCGEFKMARSKNKASPYQSVLIFSRPTNETIKLLSDNSHILGSNYLIYLLENQRQEFFESPTLAVLANLKQSDYLHKKHSVSDDSVETVDFSEKVPEHCLSDVTHYIRNKCKIIRSYACWDSKSPDDPRKPVSALEAVSVRKDQIRKDYGIENLSQLLGRMEDQEFLRDSWERATSQLDFNARVDVDKLGKFLLGLSSHRVIPESRKFKMRLRATQFLRVLRFTEAEGVLRQKGRKEKALFYAPDFLRPLDSYGQFYHALRIKKSLRIAFVKRVDSWAFKLNGEVIC